MSRPVRTVHETLRERSGLPETADGQFVVEAPGLRLLLSVRQEEGYGESMLCVRLSGIDGFEPRLRETLDRRLFMPDGPGSQYTYVLRPQTEEELETVVRQLEEIIAELRAAQTEGA